ncbi:MAG: ABC transporter ATP-binding protein [Bacilli bacterium]|nr:ABC transporter ATP-binding protein [Bacilli bacterium]
MKNKPFKLIFEYLKEDKLKLFIYLFLVLITYIPEIGLTFLWGLAVEALINKDFNMFVIYLISWQSILILIYSLLSTPRDLLYNYLEIKFNKNVIKDLYHKISDLPAIAFEEIGVGEFINRMTDDPHRVMELLAKLIKMTCKTLIVIAVIIISFTISFILGLEIIIFAIIMGFISAYFFPKIKKTQEIMKKQSDKQVKTATENITGIREIKSLGIKKNIEIKLFKNIDEHFNSSKKIRTYEVIYYNLNNLTYFILQFIILLTSGYLLIKGKMSYSSFIVIESYIWRIDDIVESISDFGVNYTKVVVSLNRINEILKNKLYKDEQFGNIELTNPKGVISFKNVEFKYREDEEYTLNNLNLTLEPNKKIAIIGKSGNGKSTIFNLLCRYFDTTNGEILIDDINIKDLTEESLRNTLSIIRQTPFIFNLSILDNFKLVKDNITLKEVIEVCKKAYIHDYIMSLPKQYDTIIGEGGVNLSGGQKQRLAIARTLLLNTKIILFDEATSALDNESQEYIKKTIDSLVKDHTIIIVAHRLSTIVDADIIHIIDKGTLNASGTHKELLKNNKIYQLLYKKEL